jgi:O-antigen/teichoic acid export membrane protein
VTIVTLLAAGSNVVLNLLLIPAHGIEGAAAATLASYALMVVGLAVAAQRLHRIAYPWLRIAAPTAAAGAGILLAARTDSWAVRAGIVGVYGLLVLVTRLRVRS